MVSEQTFAQRRTAPFVPHAPTPQANAFASKPDFFTLLRTMRTLARNPLAVWAERHYEEPIIKAEIMGRRMLILNDPDTIHHCLVQNEDKYAMDFVRQAVLKPFLREGLLTNEGEPWKRVRKLTAPLFSPRHVNAFAMPMAQVCDEFADRLAARSLQVVSMSDEMVQLTLAHLAATLFGGEMHLDPDMLAASVEELMAIGGRPHIFDLARLPLSVPRIGRGRAHRIMNDLRARLTQLTELKRAELAKGKREANNLHTLLLSATDEDGEHLSDEEIVDNLITFIAAGHETTARSLGWTFYLLSQASEVRDRLEAEIAAADLDALPPQEWVQALPFAEAVLKESMRLYPPVAMISRKAIASHSVPGLDVEENTSVYVSPWLLHRHRKLWRDPDVFDPNRFLEGHAIHKYAYVPFGFGPRVCIGARFAMQEALISLVKLTQRFRFSYAAERPPTPNMRITTFPDNPLPMKVELRA